MVDDNPSADNGFINFRASVNRRRRDDETAFRIRSAVWPALFSGFHRSVLRSLDGLRADQAYFRPSQDANHIAWLAWHLSRWQDYLLARVLQEPEAWVAAGWYKQFGLDAKRTGMGDTTDQVGAFKPPLALLAQYVEAVHAETV